MGAWTDHVVPRLADAQLTGAELDELRREACAPLHGEVLEIGFGSGLNLPWYPPAVVSIAAVEPSDVGWGLSARRRARSPVPVERSGLDGQRLEAPDASYDAVLSTFTLCSVPDAGRALAEAARVLRPRGVLCFLEHGLAPEAGVARWQRRLEPLQRRLLGGCHLTRDVPALVAGAGFEITVLRSQYLDGPRLSHPWGRVFLGCATPA
jgi:SAM-dependent methyltransferase